MNLKDVFKNEIAIIGMKSNLRVSNADIDYVLSKLNNVDFGKDDISVCIDGHWCYFENTLYKDKEVNLYLFESRTFSKSDGSMLGAYLEVFDEQGNLVDECIEDVWSYSNWKMCV